MAFISTEKTKLIRQKLKQEYPMWKFSLKKHNHSSLKLAILRAPIQFTETAEWEQDQINHYYPENYNHPEELRKIISILNGEFLSAKERNFDLSDCQTDYFHVGWYISISQGDYDKPFELIDKTQELFKLI